MEKKTGLLGILVVILAVSIVISCAREKIQLQLRLQEGESHTIKVLTDQNISQTIQGQRHDIIQTTGTGHTFDVEEVDADGNALVKVTYRSVLFKQDGPMGKIEYDSSNPPAIIPPMAMGFAALVGQSFSMMISPDGHIIDVQGVDAMLTHVMKKLDIPEGPMKVSIEESLKNQFGDQALTEIMESMMAIYPEKPVGIGDSWTRKVVISKGFPMILDNTWTLKDRKGGVAIIEVSSTVNPNPEAAPIEMGTMRLSYDISGEQEGTIELQEATGWTTRAKFTQNFSGLVKIGGTPQMPEGMSWPISIDSVVSYEPFTEW